MWTFKKDVYEIEFLDGIHWTISALDYPAALVVSLFAKAMGFNKSDYSNLRTQAIKHNRQKSAGETYKPMPSRLLVCFDVEQNSTFLPPQCSYDKHESIVCRLHRLGGENEKFVHFLKISLTLARQSQNLGGVLLHGALAEWNGFGIILIGAGGTGKTTASRRLPPPWKSLSDDLTFVVRDSQNTYWAHPWPTWSRFLQGDPDGTWNVQKAVPLRSIFFLKQSDENRVTSVGNGLSTRLLLQSIQQASILMIRGLGPEKVRQIHLQWFDNICPISKSVPLHTLEISLTGPFWQEIEPVLEK
jgi:SynChlorMet cassette protein ScmC